jgi:outer membrane lipoprotein-sorting protein
MNRNIITAMIAITTVTMICQGSQCCPANAMACGSKAVAVKQAEPDTKTLVGVLEKLQVKTAALKSMEAKIEYLFIRDPGFMNMRTVQTGMFYYQKQKKGSKIRINFDTKKIDDEKVQKDIVQIIFDGVWLTRIDYQLETVKYDQQAEEDKPVEVFEFISENFPMIGFTKTEELEKQFEITMLENKADDPNTPIHLRLKPKPGSKYVKDYSRVNFWIDKKTFLPSRLVSTTTGDGDIYDMKFKGMKANKRIDEKVFKVEVPAGFAKSKRVLERE